MSAGKQLEIAARLKQLWKGLLPALPIPGDEQFLSWAQLASEEIVCHAFNRGRKKAYQEREAGIAVTGDSIGRFITGVIVREREERRIA
jgi:hypothetical protein